MHIDYCLFPDNSSRWASFFENFFSKEDKGGFSPDILKIDISLEPAVWQITFADNLLPESTLQNVSRVLCERYGLNDVTFEFCANGSRLFLMKDCLLCAINEKHPDINLLLERAGWQLLDDKIMIALESDFLLERIKQKNIDIIFKNTLNSCFKGQFEVCFHVDKTSVPETDQEEEYISEEYLAALSLSVSNKSKENNVIFGKSFSGTPVNISSIQEEENKVIVQGTISGVKETKLRTGRVVLRFNIFDETDAILAKMHFETADKYEYYADRIKDGLYVKIWGNVQNDVYERNELLLMPKNIILAEKTERMDTAEDKRVELHAHTKMSALDSVMPIKDYIQCAAKWGHKAVAITDHGVVQAFPDAYKVAKPLGVKIIFGLEGYMIEDADDKSAPYHIVLLAASQKGLYNLYKLVSLSHLNYYYKRPRIPKQLIEEYREGLILGSACEAGDLYRAILEKLPEEKIEEIANFYDYLEIQPNGNNQFLIRQNKVKDVKELCQISKKIIELGKKLNKPVIATCDVHFLEPQDEVYRRILQGGQGYSDADEQPPLFFRTTEEMLAEFSYLGEQLAYEVVVKNPQQLAEQIPFLQPVPDALYSPQIPGASDEVFNMSHNTAKKLYGENLPQIVVDRLKLELNSIIGNGFSELYLIAHKLVKKSLDDGYIVGSRGSVGSSFVATMMNITEVNPLPPHYRCQECSYSEFIIDGSYGCGFDLPIKICPHCKNEMIRDGHNIPFAVFLGFDGDKVPDIDLNFSGEYQPQAHKYTEELFGRSNVFRAGTISSIAVKTAAGFARKYFDDRGIIPRNARIDSIAPGCEGVKRTTGQHPGGIMVVPRDMDIHYFTPVQRPADDSDSDTITTHFDYHSINDRLVKLDILGHDAPTIIRMLEDMTGLSAGEIPFNDEETTSLFYCTDALGITAKELGSNVGTLGIPEFGTNFVRQMLEDTKPKCFSDLVRISGYSHGEEVWINNAQDLIKSGTAKVAETISARDDIMVSLIQQDVEPLMAFNIMENVRKGKGIKEKEEKAMQEKNVPEWYIESCRKIKYLFPKAHATAYVMMAYRIAYCKVHHPEAFYASYFTIKADDFDADIVVRGLDEVKSQLKLIGQKGREASDKEKRLVTVLELAHEMYLRKLQFLPIDIYKSHPTKFLITQEGLLPPLIALAGLGKNAALSIDAARAEGPFISKNDLRLRSGVSKTVIELLTNHGSLSEMPDSNQTSLF